ncbi:HlyD family type I secretion periplasmic adaptor subunit [Aquirhabdus sp.]|uniref:HlyD family type I secretion periplasmic adaptor subunit n=1 Tax=Aquirhabdus sp. TaxID=2824160 RepID=UPI00396CCD8A
MSIRHRFAASRELWRRYKTIFAHHWAERHTVKSGIFNEDEADFLPAALSLQEKPASKTAHLTAWLLMSIVIIAVIWSILGKIDIVVNATGKVIPSGYTKTIASVEVAAVRAIHVEEGKVVKAGDVLVELDASATDAEHTKAKGDAQVAALQMARSKALISAVDHLRSPQLAHVDGVSPAEWQAEQAHVVGQYQDFKTKLDRINSDIAQYSTNLPLARQRANDYKALSLNHDVSEHAWIEKEQARIELEGQLNNARDQRAALIAETKKNAFDALTEGAKLNAASQQDAKRAGEHSKLLVLRAPVDGTIQQLNVHTVGGVVQAAQPLMLIVPKQKQVEVEAYLENKDIGFVHEGQIAAVKVDAFDYTKYGTIPAKVTHVSRDAVQNDQPEQNDKDGKPIQRTGNGLRYAVRITLDRSTINVDGTDLPLSAGMSVNAEVKTGTRRVIEYILSPLVQHEREALHER